MGRKRKHNPELGRGLTLERGTYFYRGGKERKRHNLGQDFAKAMELYGKLLGPQKRVRTVHDVIERYRLEVLPKKRSETTRIDQARALTILDQVFGEQLPDEILATECYAYLDARKSKDGTPAPVAARHEISLLGHVLAKAIRWGAGIANVVRTLERIPKGERERYVSDEEFAACRALANPRMQLAMDLARNVGQRRGNLLSLKFSQISDAGITFPKIKKGKAVLVAMTPKLKETIDACKAMAPQIPREYVLRTRDGTRYSARGFSAIWQRLMKKFVDAGGERFTFHDLRAKAASDKETLAEAQALLGHQSPETTERVYRRGLSKATPVE